ncbi:MAG: polymer-forming cytoskeletal protein [Chloroflexi bacterium]|nr:polymer-forming cytoskeletal protein [Chloroflexota bacterium]
MKRILVVLVMLVFVAFAATPAFAQGSRAGDRVCTSGSTVIRADETVNSVLLFGCGARIQSGAQVRRDIVSSGGDVVIEDKAVVQNDIVVFGGNLDIAGEVLGDVAVFGGNITLESTAVIGGNVAPIGGNLDRKEGAVVRGTVSRGTSGITPPRAPTPPTPFSYNWFANPINVFFGFVRVVLGVIALAAVGALTVAFWPSQTKQVAQVAQGSALPSLGVGCLTWIAVIVLSLLLVITICGIPFAVFVWLAIIIATLVGWVALGWLVGERVMNALHVRQADNVVIAAVVGVFLLALLSAAPIIGWLAGLIVAIMGLGAVVLTRFGTRAYPSLAPATVTPTLPTPPAPPVAPTPPAPPPPAPATESSETGKVES